MKNKLLASASTPVGDLRLTELEDDFVVSLVRDDVVQWRVHHRVPRVTTAARSRASQHKAAKNYYDRELKRLS